MITKYLEKIEYNKIKDILKKYCKTYIGINYIDDLQPMHNKKDVLKALNQTSDAVLLLYKKGTPPISSIENTDVHIKRLENGDFLTIKQLLDLTQILKMANDLKKYFSNIDENNVKDNVDLNQFESLYDLFDHLYINKDIEQKISVSIVDENTIADTASTKLNKIRHDKHAKEQEIRNKLNSFLRTKYVQEPVVTIRSGRFVVPIKNEYRSEVKGIIHDISSSGQTVFIEPLSVFDLNNDISSLGLEENAEIEKILQMLSSLFFNITGYIQNNINLIGLLDFIFAKAKYSKEFDMCEPQINSTQEINLLNAWHPLIEKETAIKNNISIGNNYTSLIITGPNTGGKTVTLKTVGILCSMGLSGMHIPAKEGSSICMLDNIFADIGDEQSIADSISTFSSHMLNVADIINKVTDKSLVLLDELGSGTDPIEGSSLAICILEDLHARGALTIATTHYPEIKHYVLVTEGFENASVEFNIDTLSPTYKLLLGVPGTSNAFAISKKLGIPEYIVNNAKKQLDENQVNIEELLKQIYDDKKFIEEQKIEIETKAQETEKLNQEAKKGHSNLKEQEEKILEKAKQEARDILIDAKEQASSMIKELENGDNKKFNHIRNDINKKITDLKTKKITPPSYKALKTEEIKIGMKVNIPSINQTGNIITMPNKDNMVTVQVGIIKMNYNVSDLELNDEPDTNNSNKYNYSKEHKMNIKTVSPEINVIGQTVEEACQEIDRYLDMAARSGLHECRIVHGKGTGALRKGVQQFLKSNPHVKTYRVGTFGEGEMGVTIVELK